MKIKKNRELAICSVDILDINCVEMKQMSDLNNRIKNILNSHKKDSEKKEYISDDDLNLMYAILSVFTKEYSSSLTSAFDDFLKEQNKPAPQSVEEKIEDTPLIDPYHEDQTFG